MKIWKKTLAYSFSFVLTVPLVLSIADSAEAKKTYVKGHYRNGKWVDGYYRETGSGSSYSSGYSSSPYTTGHSHSNRYLDKYKTNGLVYVSGYFRNGSFVRPHWRTNPNSIITDNLSYQGISLIPPLEKEQKTSSNTTSISTNTTTHIYTNVNDIKSYLNRKNPSTDTKQTAIVSDYATFLYAFDPNNLATEQFNTSHPAVRFYQEIFKEADFDKIALFIAQDITEINGLPADSVLQEPIILWSDFENETLYPMSSSDSKSVQDYLIAKMKELDLRGLTENQLDKLRNYIFHLSMFREDVKNNFNIVKEMHQDFVQSDGNVLYKTLGFNEERATSLVQEDIRHYD